MVIFINGSINAGKTTTGKLLAKRLKATFLDFDVISESIPGFDVEKSLPEVFTKGIKQLNDLDAKGKDVVATYVINYHEYERLEKELKTKQKYYFTLAPRLEVAQSKRGNRELSEWEKQRIAFHYQTGINNPGYGKVIDNSEMSPEQVVEKIIRML